MLRCIKLMLLLAFGWPLCGLAQVPTYTWTILIPEHDTRAPEFRDYDEYISRETVGDMNTTEKVFQHHLSWQKLRISELLSAKAPFCEIDFDPVKPLILTPSEKRILREYLKRGGFLVLGQDTYPYTRAEYYGSKHWPILDFVTRDLPAADPNYTVEKITDQHPMFHQFYHATIGAAELRELKENPDSPDYTLVSYRGHPCVFILGNYIDQDDGSAWMTVTDPGSMSIVENPESYALNVNLYIYVTMH